MQNRIKYLRKEVLKKTQDDFSSEIGLSRNFIAQIETGAKVPSDRTIKDICRVFSVNETWLRTGEGEMFIPKSVEQELIEFTADLLIGEKDDFKKRLFSSLAKLSEEQWELLEGIIDVISQQKRE